MELVKEEAKKKWKKF